MCLFHNPIIIFSALLFRVVYRVGVLCAHLILHVLTDLFLYRSHFLHGLKICKLFGHMHKIFFFTLSLRYIDDLVIFWRIFKRRGT